MHYYEIIIKNKIIYVYAKNKTQARDKFFHLGIISIRSVSSADVKNALREGLALL